MNKNDLPEVLTLLDSGMSYADLGAHFGVSRQRIYQVVCGYSNRSKIFLDIRETVLRIDGRKCQLCGIPGTDPDDSFEESAMLTCHHIDKDRQNNSLPNLITLCQSCHSSYHAHEEEMEDIKQRMIDLASWKGRGL